MVNRRRRYAVQMVNRDDSPLNGRYQTVGYTQDARQVRQYSRQRDMRVVPVQGPLPNPLVPIRRPGRYSGQVGSSYAIVIERNRQYDRDQLTKFQAAGLKGSSGLVKATRRDLAAWDVLRQRYATRNATMFDPASLADEQRLISADLTDEERDRRRAKPIRVRASGRARRHRRARG